MTSWSFGNDLLFIMSYIHCRTSPIIAKFHHKVGPFKGSLRSSFNPFSPFKYRKKKRITERCSLVAHSSSTAPFWLLKPASEHAHARLLPTLSWNWTVLLLSEIYYIHYSYFNVICDLFTNSLSYILSFINIGAVIQKLIGDDTQTDTQRGNTSHEATLGK
jgi:hypothetical protein